MKKVIVFGIGDRDYHYESVKHFRINGSQLHIECHPYPENKDTTFVATHPIKRIGGWAVIESK